MLKNENDELKINEDYDEHDRSLYPFTVELSPLDLGNDIADSVRQTDHFRSMSR